MNKAYPYIFYFSVLLVVLSCKNKKLTEDVEVPLP